MLCGVIIISITKPIGKAQPVVHARAGNISSTLLADVPGIQVALGKKELDLNVEERKGKRRERKKRRVKIRTRRHQYDIGVRNSNWEMKGEDGG